MQAFISEKNQGGFSEHYFCILLESSFEKLPEVSIEKKSGFKTLMKKTFGGQKAKNQGIAQRFVIKAEDANFSEDFFQDKYMQQIFAETYEDIRGKFEIKQGTIKYKELVHLPAIQHQNQERFGRLIHLVQQMATRVTKMN